MVSMTAERFGCIDILFANAGSYVAGKVARGDPDEFDRVVDINVKSVFRAVRAVLPDMIARRSGDIVVTSSISGHQKRQLAEVTFWRSAIFARLGCISLGLGGAEGAGGGR